MEGEKAIDEELPKRFFATGHFPIRRLNIYSKLDLICFIEEKLHGTEELGLIKSSQFGRLFKLPANQCATSCKLIQAMMARQLVTNKKYEMWIVFAGTPLRFSLLEFAELTGLLCGSFPRSYYASQRQTVNMGEGSAWQKFVGDTEASLSDVADLLSMTGPEMPGWRKLGLALILIIDGVLIANLHKSRPTPKYVDMLSDRDLFFGFPWGRECFKNTIAAMTPPINSWGRCDDDYDSFTNLMLQKTLTVKGFPQVLQLLAYRSVPRLLEKLPNKGDKKKLCEVRMAYLQKSGTLTKDEILEVEHEPNVVVKPMIDLEGRYQDQWVDEIRDSSVNKLVSLIRKKHVFTDEDWIGGDNSEPKYEPKRRKIKRERQSRIGSKRKGKEHVLTPETMKPRRTLRKRSNRKQTKIGEYFAPTNITVEEINVKVDSNSARIEKLEAELRKVKAQADKYKRLYKESRIVRFGKLSSQKVVRCGRRNTKSEDGSLGRSDEDLRCTWTTFEHGGKSTEFEERGTSSPKNQEVNEDLQCTPTKTDHEGTKSEDGSLGRSDEDLRCTWTTFEHGGKSTEFEERGTSSPKNQEVNENLQCTPTKTDHEGTSTEFQKTESCSEVSEKMAREEKPAPTIVLTPEKLKYSPTFASLPTVISQEKEASTLVNEKSEDSSHSLVRKTRPALLRSPHKVPFGLSDVEVIDTAIQQVDVTKTEGTVDVHTGAVAQPLNDADATSSEAGRVLGSKEPKVQFENPEKEVMDSAKKKEGAVETDEGNIVESIDDLCDDVVKAKEEIVAKPVASLQSGDDVLKVEGKKMEEVTCLDEATMVEEVKKKESPLTSKPTSGDVVPKVEEKKMSECVDGATVIDEVKKKESPLTSKPTEISGGEDNTSKTSETEEVDDETTVNSPPKKRRKRVVNSYDERICKLLKRNRENRPREATELFPALESDVFELVRFSSESTLKRVHKLSESPDFTNQILMDIATPQRWIESTHMEVLMYMLDRLHSRVLAVQRATFVSPYFINLVYAKVDEFKRPKDKRRIKWSQNIKKFIKNEMGEWLGDFDTIYIPMSIENKHWVGLAINLQMSSIEVLDPNCDYMTDKKICEHLQHLAVALPHVLKTFCSFQYGVNVRDTPFLVERTKGLYKNERGGDCGPVAVKFMEMHLYGSSHAGMASLDDKTVDRLRKQYAVDVYAGCLMPEYD